MRRTQLYRIMPWVGGINTSVDPGVLNSQELVQADNVQFSSTGARIKREAFEYLDNEIGAPDFRSSTGTTRTLKWTTSTLIGITTPDERLVVGEHITITGNTNYAATDVKIDVISPILEVTHVTCVADSSGSLAGKYFLISAGDSGTDYYVWYKVSGSGSDPSISGRTGVEVDISTNASANTVASATQAVIDALSTFSAMVSTNVVSVTAALGGLTAAPSAGTSGFTVSVITKGGHSITYTASSSLSESLTAAGTMVVARASSVIMVTDYWRFNGSDNAQLLVYATDDFQLFRLDDDGHRVQIHGQEQVSVVVCGAASTVTGGHYFLLNAGNDVTEYYVWYKKGGVGSDPALSNKTGIEVDIGGTDTDAQVATATQLAIDALTDFSATVVTNTVTVTATSPGITTETTDFNTGFTFSTSKYGATAPAGPVRTIRTNKFNERLQIYFSGIGNFPIIYNPEDDAKYQLMGQNSASAGLSMPDASFAFNFLSRVWANDKNNPDYLHYSETFDETLWLGFGDSGALPVNPGDGDPKGITNAYSYKEMVVAAKGDVRYRIVGDSPENFQPQKISDGLGNEGACAIPVDETDVVFISKRGVHSQAVTDQYGDVASQYLSVDIKPTFNTFEAEKLDLVQGAYIPELNSFALAIAEQGQTAQNAVWLLNVQAQVPNKQRSGAWYRWPNASCTALSRQLTSGVHKIVMGTINGRIVRSQKKGVFADFGTTGIKYTIKSGTIYPGDDPQTMKAFKRISFFYRPKGNFSFTVQAKIDNQQSQGFSFSQSTGVDLLGVSFILGTSVLGSSSTLAPFTQTMEGYGRGITLTITQPTIDEQLEIWGISLEWEDVKLEQETQ